MKRVSNVLFAAVLFAFSAVLAVLSLFASIKLAAVNDAAEKLTKATEELYEQNDILLATIEKSISMDELERYAVEELGMCRRTVEQIETIDISKYIN